MNIFFDAENQDTSNIRKPVLAAAIDQDNLRRGGENIIAVTPFEKLSQSCEHLFI